MFSNSCLQPAFVRGKVKSCLWINCCHRIEQTDGHQGIDEPVAGVERLLAQWWQFDGQQCAFG